MKLLQPTYCLPVWNGQDFDSAPNSYYYHLSIDLVIFIHERGLSVNSQQRQHDGQEDDDVQHSSGKVCLPGSII
jgi:hypothetical protein